MTDEQLGITQQDVEKYGRPCPAGRRCLIPGPHTGLDHLRLGLQERAAQPRG